MKIKINDILKQFNDNKLVKINDNLYLTKKDIEILDRYKIDYMNSNSIRDLMIKIENLEDLEDYEELDILLNSLNERNYYENTKK